MYTRPGFDASCTSKSNSVTVSSTGFALTVTPRFSGSIIRPSISKPRDTPLRNSGRELNATQDRFHTCHQLAHREGLYQVVVGAHFEADNAVELRGPGREDEDRRVVRAGPQRSANIQAIAIRQHEVEDHEIVAVSTRSLEAATSRVLDIDVEAGVGQVKSNQPGDIRLVLYHQDVLHVSFPAGQ